MNIINLVTELYSGDMTAANMFFYLLAKAAPEDCAQKGHQVVRGEYLCTKKELMDTLHLSRYKFDAALKILVDNGKITVSASPQFTIIAITNYESYSECKGSCQSAHKSANETADQDTPIKQEFVGQIVGSNNIPISMPNSMLKERNEEEKEKKERNKERKEREEAKRENIPPYPPYRGEVSGGKTEKEKDIRASLEDKANLFCLNNLNGQTSLEVGESVSVRAGEQREKKESRGERKEKGAAPPRARPKYFLTLAEAHRLIEQRLAGKSDALAATLKEWATMRYALRKDGRMTERAISNAFDFLNRQNYGEQEAIACVQQSIDHLWLGLFKLQTPENGTGYRRCT